MKRWMLLLLLPLLVIVIVAASILVLRLRLANSPQVPITYLVRTPHSAYKYDLCTEALAYAHASPDEPHKTNYTFQDPFRMTDDTIIPNLMDWNPSDNTVSFQVIIMVGQVNTFTETIAHVKDLDGISVMLPDKQNQLQRASEPQFIVSSLSAGGGLAILDFTCAQQWKWRAVAIS
jgi:hypothetical protein